MATPPQPLPHPQLTPPHSLTPTPPLLPAELEGKRGLEQQAATVLCLVRQMFQLLGQLALSPRKTGSTGFHLLLLCLLGWGKELSLCFDPPLPTLWALPA